MLCHNMILIFLFYHLSWAQRKVTTVYPYNRSWTLQCHLPRRRDPAIWQNRRRGASGTRDNLYANLYALNNDVRRCLPTRPAGGAWRLNRFERGRYIGDPVVIVPIIHLAFTASLFRFSEGQLRQQLLSFTKII